MLGEDRQGRWDTDNQQGDNRIKRLANLQLTLGDLIKIVSQFSRDEREVTLAVADLINRGLIRLGWSFRRARVVVPVVAVRKS
jgi:hypothetical protein